VWHADIASADEVAEMTQVKHPPGPLMTPGNTMNSEDYRHLAAEEAALARAAVSNASRAQHYAMAAYYRRLAEAKERLATVTEITTGDASSGA
jgi:hypothetical protein